MAQPSHRHRAWASVREVAESVRYGSTAERRECLKVVQGTGDCKINTPGGPGEAAGRPDVRPDVY